MPTFIYEAMSATGKPSKGTMEASSSEEVIQKLRGEGMFPTQVKPQKEATKAAKAPKAEKAKKKGFKFTMPGKVKSKQLTLFTRQLSTLQDAGLPLLRSLQILEQQQKPGKMKTILGTVCEDVEGGNTLSESFRKHPRAFDHLYSKMVEAGEIGGVLDVILQRLADFMEKGQRLARRIKGAMIYPACVISIAIAIVTGIMYFVIPKFQEIFKDFGVKLPAPTEFLINSSKWVAGTSSKDQSVPGVIWILAAPFAIFFGFKLIRKTPIGRKVFDVVLLRVPGVGNLTRKTVVARFTRTLGTLISAGVPILEAVKITRDTCGNYVFEQALNKVHDSIREGESFSTPLRESKVVDSIVVNMIDVGEETGDMDVMLTKIADNYDEEVDVAVGSLLSLLEPFMVIILGGIIGGIVLALFLPLVSMIESVSGGGKKP